MKNETLQMMSNIGGLFVFICVVGFIFWALLVVIFAPMKKKRNQIAERNDIHIDETPEKERPIDLNSRRRNRSGNNSVFDS